MYLDGIETVHSQTERNEDHGLKILTEAAEPFGLIRKDGEITQELRDIAHWFLLYNSPELEKYLEYVYH